MSWTTLGCIAFLVVVLVIWYLRQVRRGMQIMYDKAQQLVTVAELHGRLGVMAAKLKLSECQLRRLARGEEHTLTHENILEIYDAWDQRRI